MTQDGSRRRPTARLALPVDADADTVLQARHDLLT